MLNVTYIQSDLFWENPTANLAMFEEKISQINQPTDLIVLPEMFNTGFTMNTQTIGEVMNLHTFKWMKMMAAQTKAVVTGSYIVKENNQAYNRLIWMQPDGQFDYYDKKHLFRMGKEHEAFEPGTQKIIKEIKGWKICPLICYDLRFPVWSRNLDLQYDLLLYTANWPAPRSQHWNTLLLARAIENQAYVLGLNRIGTDGRNLEYSGDSAMIDFKGQYLHLSKNQAETISLTLDKQALDEYRNRFPAYLDADKFEFI
jgi:omega-amidase